MKALLEKSRTLPLFIYTSLFVGVHSYLTPKLSHATGGEGKVYSNDTLTHSKDKMDGVVINGTSNDEIPTVEMPNVTIDVAQNFVERKGFDIIALLQTFAQPFSIALFIFGAFLALIGAFGKTGAVLKGLLVMGIAVIVYATVMYAPQLLDLGNGWLKS